jgi:hypothetical protein
MRGGLDVLAALLDVLLVVAARIRDRAAMGAQKRRIVRRGQDHPGHQPNAAKENGRE